MQIAHANYHLHYTSPCGLLRIQSDGKAITKITRIKENVVGQDFPNKVCQLAKQQLIEYFNGERESFDVPIDVTNGSPFQQSVWAALQEIPFGKTTSYGALANHLENPKAVRAVGTANGKNPILIMIPCHRVVGRDGSLTGFSAGLDMKKALLELESGETVGVQASLFS